MNRSAQLLKLFVIGHSLAIVVSVAAVGLLGSAKSALVRGDFPAFYAAGIILRDIGPAALYDVDVQRLIQNESWPSYGGEFHYFAYPVTFAALFLPLSYLTPILAKVVWSIAQLVLLFGSLALLKPHISVLRKHFTIAFLGCISFLPLTLSLVGGQNSALSLFIFASSSSLLLRGKYVFGGFILGFWLFKPHFALIALLLFGLYFGSRVLYGFIVCVLLQLALVIQYAGFDWYRDWLEAVLWFSRQDHFHNKANLVSLVDILIRLEPLRSLGPLILSAILVAAGFCCLLLAGDRLSRSSAGLILVPCAVVLLSPHTMFYDSSLMLPAVLFAFADGKFSNRLLWPGLSLWVFVNISVGYTTGLFRSSIALFTLSGILILLKSRKVEVSNQTGGV